MKTIKIIDKTPDTTSIVTEFDFTSFPSLDDLMKTYETLKNGFTGTEHNFYATRDYYVGTTPWTITKVFMSNDGIVDVEYIENGTSPMGKPYCELKTAGLRELYNWIYD